MWFRFDFAKAVKVLKQSNQYENVLWGFGSARKVPLQLEKLST